MIEPMRATRGATWCLLLSLIGLGLAGYLFYLHVGLLRGELLGGAVCGGSGVFNCHAVTAGPWGSFLGMPLVLWGLLGYLAIFALALLAQQSPDWSLHALTLIAVLALAFVAIDLVLFGLMAFVIRFYCLFCLLTYAVNLSLLVVAVRALGLSWPNVFGQAGSAMGALAPSRARPAATLFWGMMGIAVAAVVGLDTATTFATRGSVPGRDQLRQFVSTQPRATPDITGDPRHGPPNAKITLVEFSDFLCPSCQRASQLNAIILANHRHDTALVFKHYPLDTSCNSAISRMVHPGACTIAAASECLHQQGKFWPFHDLVFERVRAYDVKGIEEDVRQLGADVTRFRACMDAGQGLEAVKRDIAEGAKLGVSSTPTFLINGLVVSGGISPAVFEDFLAVLSD